MLRLQEIASEHRIQESGKDPPLLLLPFFSGPLIKNNLRNLKKWRYYLHKKRRYKNFPLREKFPILRQ